jgi:2-aminoadipate transaminase
MAHATRNVSRFAAWLADGQDSAAATANRAVANPASLGVGVDLVGLSGGQPAEESYPLGALERAFSRAILEDGAGVLPYGPTQGLLALRQVIAERLARRGIHVGPENVLILTGSIQGLHLVGRITLDHGDTILTEAPTFMGAYAAWDHVQPRYVTVPVDDQGMRLDLLRERLSQTSEKPRFMYLLPTFQNPMGVSMSLDRRRHVLDIARELDLLIIEDDPYGEFWFDEASAAIPPIRSLPGAEERVVYLGTFSKILAPGIRLAYAIAPPELVEHLLRAKRGVDFHSDGLLQQAVVRLIRDPEFDLEGHVADGRRLYRARRDAMLDALEPTLVNSTWTRPGGGFFLWIDMPRDVSGNAVAVAAQAEGVAVLPGGLFYPNRYGGSNGLRLSFSNATPDRIREGIRRLQRAIASVGR